MNVHINMDIIYLIANLAYGMIVIYQLPKGQQGKSYQWGHQKELIAGVTIQLPKGNNNNLQNTTQKLRIKQDEHH